MVMGVAIGWATPTGAENPGSIGGVEVSRVNGGDRIATAIAISQNVFTSAPAAVLARADNAADALTAAPLAHHLGGPILLVSADELIGSVARELERLGVGEVVIMGGPQAISSRVEHQLANYQVRRVAGHDRFETSAEVARLLPTSRAPRVYLAAAGPDGLSYPDAMALAPLTASEGNPVVLVERDQVPRSVRAAIYELDSRPGGLAGVVAVGGTNVISQAVQEELERHHDYEGAFPVSRIAGGNRFETAAALYDEAIGDARQLLRPTGRWLASGSSLDAMAAGPAIAALGETLLLVDGEDLRAQPSVVDRLRGRRDLLQRVVLVGGEAAIGGDAEQELREVLLQDDLGAPRCLSEQLRATLQQHDGATGNQYQSVEIVNLSDTTCTLEGHPSVQLLDAQGEPLQTSVQYGEDEVEVVPLAPQGRPSERLLPQAGQAGVGLAYRTQGEDTCGPQGQERVVTATAVEVGLPSGGQVVAKGFDETIDVRTCEGRLTVTPILDADAAGPP